MVQKDTILYFEDNDSIRLIAQKNLEIAFPNYKILVESGNLNSVKGIFNKLEGVEYIAIVCTDGNLIGGMKGWDIVEDLRQRQYNGPSIYTGVVELPQDKKHLYVGEAHKTGQNLIDTIKKYI